MFSLGDLPNEVIELILLKSNASSIISFSETCKLHYNISRTKCIKEVVINKPGIQHLTDKQIHNLYDIVTNNVSGNLYLKDNLICTDVKTVEFGDEITIVILKNGSVYGYGNNRFGILGTKPPYKEESDFIKLPIENVKQISIGHGFILYLDYFGNVYRSGRNQNGEVGSSKGRKNIRGIEKIPVISNIKAISCGKEHSLFLDYNGNVYSCGLGHNGKLGLKKEKTGRITKIDGLPKIVKIKATNNRSYFITKEGIVYYCGYAKYTGGAHRNITIPEVLEDIPPINKIIIPTTSFLSRGELFITVDNSVYASTGYIYYPKHQLSLNGIVDVAFINETTILCLTISGTVYEYSIERETVTKIYDTLVDVKKIMVNCNNTYRYIIN